MKPSLLNPDWKYDSHEASTKPGYLAAKFKKMMAEQKKSERKVPESTVVPITKKTVR